jgi:mxaA protein
MRLPTIDPAARRAATVGRLLSLRPMPEPPAIGHAGPCPVRRFRHALLAAALWLAASATLAQTITIRPIAPRPFGYSIGDRIERTVLVDAPSNWILVEDWLRGAARRNVWFELAHAQEVRTAAGATTRHELHLVYQLLNSPAEPTVLLLPRLALRFEGDGAPVERDVPPAEVFAAPLLPASAAGSTLDAPRPDRAPQPIPTGSFATRFAIYGVVALVALLWLALERLHAARGRAKPFARACRELRRLAHRPDDGDRSAAAMRIVHRALDQTAGHAVFLENLERLFGARPQSTPLRERTRAFLQQSRRRFFAGADDPVALEDLRALARAWRDAERAPR